MAVRTLGLRKLTKLAPVLSSKKKLQKMHAVAWPGRRERKEIRGFQFVKRVRTRFPKGLL